MNPPNLNVTGPIKPQSLTAFVNEASAPRHTAIPANQISPKNAFKLYYTACLSDIFTGSMLQVLETDQDTTATAELETAEWLARDTVVWKHCYVDLV